MLGKSLTYLTEKRKRLLTRSDTAPTLDDDTSSNDSTASSRNNNTNCHPATVAAVAKSANANLTVSSVTASSGASRISPESLTDSVSVASRASSPPSTIRYRIRDARKSPVRKLSDTSTASSSPRGAIVGGRRSNSSHRSRSIDHSKSAISQQQKLFRNVAAVAIQLTKPSLQSKAQSQSMNSQPSAGVTETGMKLSRSLSKRMPRSGSAKNLMELRDDSSLVWNDGKLMQREIANLFKAVEANDLRAVESLLASCPGIVNSYNAIDLTPLDMAMLYNHSTVAKRLAESGGRNNDYFETESPRFLTRHLTLLTNNCAGQLLELSAGARTYGSSGSINRDIETVEALHSQLQRLKANLDQMRPGSPPRKVTLEVAGLCSLLVTVYPPSDSLVTRYRIEWSRHTDFAEIDDEITVRAKFPVGRYQVLDLQSHADYHVRVCSLNLKGAGATLASQPRSARPSCWTEVAGGGEGGGSLQEGGSVSRRVWPHPSEGPVVEAAAAARLEVQETLLGQQLQFWLASVRTSHRNAAAGDGTALNGDLSSSQAGTVSSSLQPPSGPGLPSSGGCNSGGSKKSLLKSLLASSCRFVRAPKQGLYLALLYRAADSDKLLAVNDEQLPFILVDDVHPNTQTAHNDAMWLARVLAASPDLALLTELLSRLSVPASMQLRVRLLAACLQLQSTLHARHLGLLLLCGGASGTGGCCVLQDTDYCVMVLVRELPTGKPGKQVHIGAPQAAGILQAGAPIWSWAGVPNHIVHPLPAPLRWVSRCKLLAARAPPALAPLGTSEASSTGSTGAAVAGALLEEELYGQLDSHLGFYRRVAAGQAQLALQDGLYLVYLQCRSSLEQLYVLTTTAYSSGLGSLLLPAVRVRDNWHVNAAEWRALRHLQSLPEATEAGTSNESGTGNDGARLHTLLVQSWGRLQHLVKLEPPAASDCRLYLEEVVWLRPRVRLLLAVPSLEEFCLPPGREWQPPPGQELEWSALPGTELYLGLAFMQPVLYPLWASLHSQTTDLLLPLAQHALRQAFERHEIEQARDRLEQLTHLQTTLDSFSRQLRWTVDVITNCRDRQLSGVVTLPLRTLVDSDPAARAVLCTEIHCPDSQQQSSPTQQPHRCTTDCTATAKKTPMSGPTAPPSPSERAIATNQSQPSTATSAVPPQNQHQQKGVLRIYAGYPCGLLDGTSVKVLLTPHTTAQDAVRLIVRQLNVTAHQHNSSAPQYPDSDLPLFCLVVTIDRMSRPLPDNFHPLLLKQPWRSGKLSVRLRASTG